MRRNLPLFVCQTILSPAWLCCTAAVGSRFRQRQEVMRKSVGAVRAIIGDPAANETSFTRCCMNKENPHSSLGSISSISQCSMSRFNKEINTMGLKVRDFVVMLLFIFNWHWSSHFIRIACYIPTPTRWITKTLRPSAAAPASLSNFRTHCHQTSNEFSHRCSHSCLPAGFCSLRTLAVHLLHGSVWLRVQWRICCVYLNTFASVCVCVQDVGVPIHWWAGSESAFQIPGGIKLTLLSLFVSVSRSICHTHTRTHAGWIITDCQSSSGVDNKSAPSLTHSPVELYPGQPDVGSETNKKKTLLLQMIDPIQFVQS